MIKKSILYLQLEIRVLGPKLKIRGFGKSLRFKNIVLRNIIKGK